MASRGSGCAAQLADEPDQMSLGCGAQARLPADRSGYVCGRGVLPGEQSVLTPSLWLSLTSWDYIRARWTRRFLDLGESIL
jgi:hypothetical protein